MKKKFSAGGIGLAVATITAWAFGVWVPSVPVPDYVAAAWGVLCTVGASMAIPDDREEP